MAKITVNALVAIAPQEILATGSVIRIHSMRSNGSKNFHPEVFFHLAPCFVINYINNLYFVSIWVTIKIFKMLSQSTLAISYIIAMLVKSLV